ncbi:MAG TPA: sigma 54-interacting transcriptional regulator [Thermoanaerobaculia bacterium]|nr:sigma 54-interacting transcriptional regulator [Thermoanaerobaculia bacterium]
MSPTLVCLNGPLAGRAFPLEREELSIGRHDSNRLQLPDLAASRHHCIIEPEGEGGFRLRDLASRRGTFVNGVPVQERLLEEGDLVTIGRSLFVFQSGEEGGGGTPPGLPFEDATFETTVLLTLEDSLYNRSPEIVGERVAADRTGRIARDLQALLQIGKVLQAPGSTEDLARRLLELTLATVPADRAALTLADRGEAEPATAFAFSRASGPAEPFPISRTVLRRVLEERVGLLASDILRQEGLSGAESLEAARIRSLLAAPLVHLGQPLGLLYLDTREARFDHGHLELVTAVAGMAAPALATVRRIEWLEEENRRLAAGFDADMVGESPRMREVYRLLRRAAATDSTVLLRGESGTGKELAARALHRASPRAERPFVAVNCATLSETLLESELFGHERGAFTGAVARKSGRVEVADSGTLFLDEVGEIPLPLQAKLLRFLQEREFERLGSTRTIRVDVRVVAATNRDLEKMIREGTFREDLYYRLNVITLHLPPLRERREDVPLLASHFAAVTSRRLGRAVAGFTPEARACLQRYDWPGNVRELANAVERAIVLGEGDLIRPEDLPETLLDAGPPPGSAGARYHEVLHETKRRLILDTLAETRGNVTRAAAVLGLHPNYLHRLISSLGLRTDGKG